MPKSKPENANSRTLQKYPIGRRVRYVGESVGHVVGHVLVGEFLEVKYVSNNAGRGIGSFSSRSPKFTPAPGPLVEVPEKDRILPPGFHRRELLNTWRNLATGLRDEDLEFVIGFVESIKKKNEVTGNAPTGI